MECVVNITHYDEAEHHQLRNAFRRLEKYTEALHRAVSCGDTVRIDELLRETPPHFDTGSLNESYLIGPLPPPLVTTLDGALTQKRRRLDDDRVEPVHVAETEGTIIRRYHDRMVFPGFSFLERTGAGRRYYTCNQCMVRVDRRYIETHRCQVQ